MVVVWITRSASCLNKVGRKIPQKNEREKQLCSLNITFSLLFLLFKILETAHENLFLLRSSLFLYSFIKIYNIFLLFIFSNILWFQEEMIMIGGREWIIGDIHCWKWKYCICLIFPISNCGINMEKLQTIFLTLT